MLYIFYGTDDIKIRNKINELISALRSKASEAELIRITSENVTGVNISNLLNTQGLFKRNYILYLDNIDDVFLGFNDIQLKEMKHSKNICVVSLGKLSLKNKSFLEQCANKITEYSKFKKSNAGFNIFSIANAIKRRDKKGMWIALNKARFSGVEGESVVGMAFWAVKDLFIKNNTNKYSKKELKEMIVGLSSLPHKARRKGVSIFNKLENFFLGL